MANPTNIEQEMLELLNRSRADPQGEVNRLIPQASPLTGANADITNAIRFFKVNFDVFKAQVNAASAVAPLAWNSSLNNAAAQHSAAMIAADQQSHQLPGEGGILQRAVANGYSSARLVGENIYAYSKSALHQHAGFFIDWGPSPTGIQEGFGHRVNMLNSEFKEVGISSLDENNPVTGVGPQVVTQNFGSRFNYEAQVVGVVFRDRDNDNFYDAGEGLANQTVTLRGVAGTFTTQTWTSGGYQIAAPTGVYEVTISGPSISARKSLVTLNGANVKVDANATLGVVATEGRDVFVNTAGNDSFNGLGGIDTVVFDRARSSVSVTIGTNSTVTVTGSGAGTDTLINIERLQFSDGVIALDIQGIAGQAYRLYQAAFGRVPDKPGLSHNTKLMDSGLTLKNMSDAFTTSAEFVRLYGANASNSTFVAALYQNVLGRAPDPVGEAFWINSLTTGRMDRGDVLIGFSESPENNGRVNPTITLAGISLDPTGFLA